MNSNLILIQILLIFLFSCSTKAEESYGWDTSVEKTDKESFVVENFIDGFEIPWGMCFLPNEDLLVSDRNGTLWQIKRDGRSKKKITGVPKVKYKGQGGLLDVQIHPNFVDNNLVYICFSDFLPKDKNKSFTSIVRAELKNNKLLNVQTIYKADDKFYTRSNVHYGSRLAFDNNNYLYFSIGDRGNRNQAQLLTTPNGKIHRLNDDGSIPEDNPFVNEPGAQKSIWTYGNRNPQGLVIDKKTSSVFSAEHGPRGGDELNIIEKGKNYGWPKITYGINYIGTKITKYTHKEGMEQPITHWTPSIAVCGIDFYDNNIFTNWKNNLFVGSLIFEYLERIVLDGTKVVERIKVLDKIGRVRNVVESPNGFLYIGVDGKGIIKILPN